MGNAGRSTIDITADDRQARRTYERFFDFVEGTGRRAQRRMRDFNPMEGIERGMRSFSPSEILDQEMNRMENRLSRFSPERQLEYQMRRMARSVARPIQNLPEHLRPFRDDLIRTRFEIQRMGMVGTESLDQLADAAIRSQVPLNRMMSATSSGKAAARAIQELGDTTRTTQLAVLGLSRDGTVRVSTAEAQQQMRRFNEHIVQTRQRLEQLRDAGDMASYHEGMRQLERQMQQVDRAMRAAAQGGTAYTSMLDQLGIHTANAANRAAIAMERMRPSFMRSIEHMNAMKTQSQKMMDALGDTSRIQRIDRAFLQVGDRLERMARQGTAANIALRQLGPNASMKDLMDRIMLINTGIMRMQQVALAAGIVLAGFTVVMAKAAHGPDPAEIRKQQDEITKVYEDALKSRTEAIYNAANLFKEMKIEPVKSGTLMKNLDEQVGIYKRWVDNMKNLSARIPVEMKEELYKMGPEAAGEIKALRSMSEPELARYVELWREKHRLAREAALDELGRLREETKEKIKELENSLKPLGIAWEKFKSTWAEALAPFVEIWGKIAAVVVDAGTAVGEFVNKLNELNPDLVKLIGMFAYLFTAMTLLLAPMAIGIGRAQGMKAAFSQLWMIIGQGVLGFLRIAGMASIVAAALVALGGTIMKLWKHSEIFRNSIIDGWNDIKSVVLESIEPLISKLEELWQAFLKLINVLVGSDGSSTQSFWKGFGDAIGNVINLLMKGLVPAVKFSVTVFATELGIAIDVLKLIIKGLTFVIEKIKEFAGAIAAIWNGNEGKGTSILERLGFSPEATKSIISSISTIKEEATKLYDLLQKGAEIAKKYIDALFAAFKGDKVQATKLLESLGFSSKDINNFLKSVEQIQAIIDSLIQYVKDAIPILAEHAKNVFSSLGDSLGGVFKMIGGLIKTWTSIFTGDWESAWDGIKTIYEGAFETLKGISNVGLSALKTLFKLAWLALPDDITKPLEKAAKILEQWYNDTIKFFKDLPGNTKSLLNEWGNSIETFFNELPGKAKKQLDTWKTEISNWFTNKASDIKKDLDTWWTEMSNWFDSIPDKIKTKLIGWKDAISQWFSEQNEQNIIFYNQLWEAMSTWFSSIPEKLRTKLGEWGTAISTWFDETVTLWGENLEKWWNSIAAWWTTLPERMWEQLELWWTSISTWFDQTTTRWGENLEKWWNSIVTWWTTLPERMWEQLELWWTSISTWFDQTTTR
ncbi:hypothetical protein OCF16_22265, partial [Bacillus mobilis]|nr:hypothetical protein [Bacillus mobilis]